jgi:predicted heme/steroid binding protein
MAETILNPIIQGNDWDTSAFIFQKNGDIYDLSGVTLWFTIKHEHDHSKNDDLAFIKSYWVDGGLSSGIIVDAPATGEITLTLSNSDTLLMPAGIYKYDIKLKNIGGKYETVSRGTVVVKDGVTLRGTTP